jgi:hypothetical protein
MKLNEATMQIIFIRIPEGTTVASGWEPLLKANICQ